MNYVEKEIHFLQKRLISRPLSSHWIHVRRSLNAVHFSCRCFNFQCQTYYEWNKHWGPPARRDKSLSSPLLRQIFSELDGGKLMNWFQREYKKLMEDSSPSASSVVCPKWFFVRRLLIPLSTDFLQRVNCMQETRVSIRSCLWLCGYLQTLVLTWTPSRARIFTNLHVYIWTEEKNNKLERTFLQNQQIIRNVTFL